MNNTNKLLWWLIGILMTLVISGGGMWIKAISSQVARISEFQQLRAERMSLVEGKVGGLEARLERIENKLDKISERLERR